MSQHIEDGKSNKQFVCHSDKKSVFLIGDSIRLGYCTFMREELSDMADIFFVAENCRNTQYIITNLYRWYNMFSDPALVDVVQFNCGHWDVAHWYGGEYSLTSEGEYKRNVKIIIDMIKKLFPNAKIIFATTTTMNPSSKIGVNPRNNEEISRYNDLGTEAAIENGADVIDLFAVTKEWDESAYADYCHFTPDSNKILGEIVANKLKSYL